MRFTTSLLFLLSSFYCSAQKNINWDSATWNLHKFQQHIGEERYHTTRAGANTIYSVDFKFTDRGSVVPLKATIAVNTATGKAVNFLIKGSTSRMSVINDSIVVDNNNVFVRKDSTISNIPLKPNSFTIAGYSPGTAQMLLIKYWKKNGQPKNIASLPGGNVSVILDGKENIPFKGAMLTLERYRISGLVWGNEWVWTDAAGNLYCLITNDAEGDKLEMMLQPYESLLATFLDKAAVYSMRLFSEQNKPDAKNKADGNLVTVITHGTLIDVVNKTTIKDASIIIGFNGKIKKIVTGAFTMPAEARVIDAKGKTILPGLWDMHAHFEQAEWGPAYLAAGITTVRDCGNEFGYINAIKNAIDNGTGVGPQIIKAGIIDGKGPSALGIIQADNATEAKAAVQRYKNNGFEQIKVYSSMKPDVLKAVCDEAHRLHLTVTGHIPDGITLKAGIDSGMNMVNHVMYVLEDMQIDSKTLLVNMTSPKSDSSINFLVDHKTVVDPTIGVYELVFRSLADSITDIEPNFYKLPLPLQTLFVNTGSNPKRAARLKGLVTSMKAIVKALYDRGVPIVAGTDMGMPGYSLYRELELYVQAGLTPMEALTTATITPARVMNKDVQTGSLTEGKAADIILVDGDPTQHIGDLRKITMVMKDGKVFDPQALHKMAGFGE